MTKSAELARRAVVLRVRVNNEELSYIQSKATQRRCTVSEYIRFSALRRREPRMGSLSREIAMLNCALLECAAEAGKQLDFEMVAEQIARLCALVEKGVAT